ncbi:MAG TPA: TetR/AcrR family transcriptional regulator [Burkholderiales bacterium]|jgi:AcrR family transcriptional regulator
MARPREFDEEEVLKTTLRLFWEKGYESTSLSDLMAATGLTKSSLYKAFGSKEELFWRVVERYQRDFLDFRHAALAEPTPRRIAERLLDGITALHSGEMNPVGCLELNTALTGSKEGEPIRQELLRGREQFRLRLRERFEETMAAAPLPPGMTSDDAASLIISLIQGLAVQAKAGASLETARRVARAALLSWPES